MMPLKLNLPLWRMQNGSYSPMHVHRYMLLIFAQFRSISHIKRQMGIRIGKFWNIKNAPFWILRTYIYIPSDKVFPVCFSICRYVLKDRTVQILFFMLRGKRKIEWSTKMVYLKYKTRVVHSVKIILAHKYLKLSLASIKPNYSKK